jgi:5-bromo-4-chloroindolyl phosphate hydrolysis protein
MFFDTPAKGVVDVAVTLAAVCLFDVYFAQAVLGVVVVVLGGADGLFGLGSAVFISVVIKTKTIRYWVTNYIVAISLLFFIHRSSLLL